jgi:hypothetical protein
VVRNIVFLTAALLLIQPQISFAQSLPAWAQGATPKQWNGIVAAKASLQKRLNLSSDLLESISLAVGMNYKSRGFLGYLQDLKENAELARKTKNDVVSMQNSVQKLPAGKMRDDASSLLQSALLDIEAGRLEMAQEKLTRLANLRWARSGDDLAIWMQAIVAQSDVARIRFGAESAADILATARSGLLANTTKISVELLLKQAKIYSGEATRKGTKEPHERAMAILNAGLKSLNPDEYPTESGRIHLAISMLWYELTRWDSASWQRATSTLLEASKRLQPGDGDDYIEMQIFAADIDRVYRNYDSAINRLNLLLALEGVNGSEKWRGTALHRRAIAQSDKAHWLKDDDANKSRLSAAAIADSESAIVASGRAGEPNGGSKVNLLLYKQGYAKCCVAMPKRLDVMAQAVDELENTSEFWSKSEDPASWHNVQLIIGRSFLSLAKERYNAAKLIDDFSEMHLAMTEMQKARQYYANGVAFMTETNVGSSRNSIESELKDINESISIIEKRLAGPALYKRN